MNKHISAKVIQHTRSGETELVTLEIELPRIILPQFLTHRTLSRSFQSSRAVPLKRQIQQVKDNPFLPVNYGTAQKGMVAGAPLTGFKLKIAKAIIYGLSRITVWSVKGLDKLGAAKEVANRYLEPYLCTKGVVTATRGAWEEFFKLRCNYDAQPEIQRLANTIKNEIEMSSPFELEVGEWHIPYCSYHRFNDGTLGYNVFKIPSFGLKWDICPLEYRDMRNRAAKIVSEAEKARNRMNKRRREVRKEVRAGVAGCAQVSYRTLDMSEAKTERVYKMLNLPEDGVWPEQPPHFSASEHCAMACIPEEVNIDSGKWMQDYSGNFHTKDYVQYRKMLEYGRDGHFLPKPEEN